MVFLKCEDLTLGYDGIVVVDNLTFEIEKGDYLCILGENGSGKSTLMKALLDLKPPISGNIVTSDGLKLRDIGYLPQQTITQRDFPASVKEIVLSGMLNHMKMRPFYSKAEKKTAYEQMEKLGILDLKKKCYRELSGGQQQRVLLARALCSTQKMIVLDEPVAGLDPKVTVEMYELIKELNSLEITIIMVSHDVQAAVQYANKILVVGAKSEFFASKEEYMRSDIAKSYICESGGDR